uniref:Cystatin domain-containing protein n=2 Tax=Bos TaxID=9903 RepID=A0A8B9YJT8_BOSMU
AGGSFSSPPLAALRSAAPVSPDSCGTRRIGDSHHPPTRVDPFLSGDSVGAAPHYHAHPAGSSHPCLVTLPPRGRYRSPAPAESEHVAEWDQDFPSLFPVPQPRHLSWLHPCITGPSLQVWQFPISSPILGVSAAPTAHPPSLPTAEMWAPNLGGFSDTQDATAEIQAIADQVKSQLEEKENKKFPVFKAVKFRSQVVAGMNYLIKVQVDEDDFVHIRVFESLPHENKPVALTSYQTNKSRHDELTYF